jgi:murein L,D-transpeptidase YcbB/YkuD
MFPNDFDVYLHDTTQKDLFSRQRRLFSHGCIRIEKPYALGEWVLRDNPSWSRERLVAEIKKGKRVQVNLQRPVPVHVMYLTAWVDGNGILQFRQDYYGYDSNYEEALKKIGQSKTGTLQSTRVKMSLGTI